MDQETYSNACINATNCVSTTGHPRCTPAMNPPVAQIPAGATQATYIAGLNGVIDYVEFINAEFFPGNMQAGNPWFPNCNTVGGSIGSAGNAWTGGVGTIF